jgi:superfamily II DNA/RNA helicase
MHTDTKFFTNSENNTLYDRFNATLSHNTQFFDVLVWYFRSSWFFKLYKSLEDIEKIRILVWLNVDRKSFELIDQVRKSKEEAKEWYLYWVEKEFETTDDKKEVEEWVLKFIEFIETWKLELRVYPKADIHAKVYIIRKDQAKSPDYYWSVITWSSNFSMNGLQNNLEFNVELKDTPDVNFALESFEELWKDWVDVSSEYVDTVKTKTWLNSDITPYDLYLKFLYEYFNIRINDDKKELFYTLPKWFKELEYQKDAVKEALIKLDTYNWFFLADVVWLWKTYIAALIWQQLKWNILIICPPHLQDYWNDTFQDFKVPCQVESLWQLEKIRDKWHDRYDYVFIDEWHRFRNDDTKNYELLRSICLNKKVIVISATPFNNSFKDLLSLVSLFQIPRDSNIPNLKNIDQFFKNLQSDLNKINRKTEYWEYKNKLKESSNKIRDRLLKYVMIRRTRSEIKKYFSEDIKNQWLTFPEVETPIKALYQFDTQINSLFESTIESVANLTYARYKPAYYLTTWATQLEEAQQKWLAWIMKTSIIKRLDSSFEAFKMSLSRILYNYEKFLEMYDKWDVYISKKVDVYDMIESDLEELLNLVDNKDVIRHEKKEFNDQFKKDLENDYNILKDLYTQWSLVKQDPKIDKLKQYLSWELKNKKVIIFTESKETAFYLEKELQKDYSDKVFAYSWSSDDSEKQKIKRSYDPNNSKPEDLIDILITTDVLAEWINLHRSNILINYDIPWNPTRVIQRIWRVNRVWTKHKDIFIYNFFPTEESNDVIALEQNVLSKMEAFVRLLWEDAANLSDEEEIEAHSLFDKLNSKEYLNQEWESEDKSELKYLKELRKIRDENHELFTKIANLPKKSRSWRECNKVTNEWLFTFFKKWDYLKMFLTDLVETRELDFFATAELLECDINEEKKKINNDWFYELLQKNKDMFNYEIEVEKKEEKTAQKWKSNEKDLIKIINFLLKNKWFLEHEKTYIKTFLEAMQKWIVWRNTIRQVKSFLEQNLENNNTTYIVSNLKELIPEEYMNTPKNNPTSSNINKIEVILSEYFI